MIRQSFIILDRVGERRERQIWNQGVDDWNDFLMKKKIRSIGREKKGYFDRRINEARERFFEDDAEYFAKLLPTSEHFRLYNSFKALFLDIETAGYYGYVSVIGMSDGVDSKVMIRNYNLYKDLFLEELSRHKLLVTFNGSSYDIPVLERFFGFKLKIPHIDLRHVCSRIGLTGGLKQIEKTIGIMRRAEVGDLQGHDACSLWQTFLATGDKYYLNLLVKYNEEDTVNLKRLADYAIPRLWHKLFKT